MVVLECFFVKHSEGICRTKDKNTNGLVLQNRKKNQLSKQLLCMKYKFNIH